MKKLLVVVDMQNDFVSCALGSEAAQAIVPKVKELIVRESEAGADVAFTLDTHKEGYLSTREGKLLPVPHCIRGTRGWEVVPELAPYSREALLFEKGTFGSVSLADYVKKSGYEEVTLCGVCTDICVVSNALLLKAFCPELPIYIKKDACAGTSEQSHAAALATMQSCHIIIV